MSVLRLVRYLPAGCYKVGVGGLTTSRANLPRISKCWMSEKHVDSGRFVYDIVQPIGNDEELLRRLFEIKRYESRQEENKSGDFLFQSLTADVQAEIVADNPNLSYTLKQVLCEIEKLESQRKPLNIPKTMTIDEWRKLLSFTDYRSRVTYLHSLVYGAPSLEHITELDKVYCRSLDFDDHNIEDIVGGNKTAERNIKQFIYYHETLRQDGNMVPYAFNKKDWMEVSRINTLNQRKKFMLYLLKLEISKLHEQLKSVDKRKLHEELKEIKNELRSKEEHLIYGLGQNSIFWRIENQQMHAHSNWIAVREFNAWGIPIIIDLSYHDKYRITKLGQKSLIRELSSALNLNRLSPVPFQLHITGVDDGTKADLKKSLIDENSPSLNITSQTHLDIFPPEKLVYLSPDSRNDLTCFNPDDIYVIGGIVDTADNRSPLTLSAAKKRKIRHARFPMTRVMGLHCDLNIDTCVAIMNDFKRENDWFYAMRWIPPRYLKNRIIPRETAKPAHQLIYRAHRSLYPQSSQGEDIMTRNINLNAQQYRHYYRKLLQCKSREEMTNILKQLKI